MCNQIQRILTAGRKSSLEIPTKGTTITAKTYSPTEIISVEQFRNLKSMQILPCACWYVTQNGSGAETWEDFISFYSHSKYH